MRRVVHAFLLLLVLPAGMLAQAAKKTAISSLPAKEKRWALIVGVDAYKDQSLNLRGASADAQALRDALIETGGFPHDQVFLLATGADAERDLPTRSNILGRLSHLLTKSVPKDGLFLLAFSGHGKERKGEVYLYPSDVESSDNVALLEATAVGMAWVRRQIEEAQIAQVLILLDSCRNDPGGRTNTPNVLSKSYADQFSFTTRNEGVHAYATLFASDLKERAYEYKDQPKGYFTAAVVEGLRGKASNDHGEITLRGLVKYVEDVVPKRVAADLGNDQHPWANIEGYRADDLVLTIAPIRTGISPATLRASMDPNTVEFSFWESVEKLDTPEAYDEYLARYPGGMWANLARMNLQRQRAIQDTEGPAAPARAATTMDPTQARRTAQRRAVRGDVEAKAELGRLLMLCIGGSCDLPEARRLLAVAASRGSENGRAWYASLVMTWGGDTAVALRYARELSEKGNVIAQLALAAAYENGIGVPRDLGAAEQLYAFALPALRELVEQGDSWAENRLGNYYSNGDGGIGKDETKAVELYQRAMSHGLPAAALNLGRFHDAGRGGLQRDAAKAVALYRRVAELGHPSGQSSLAYMYAHGLGGLVKSDIKAAELYSAAAAQGSIAAMNNLALMYEDGAGGLPKSDRKAVELFQKAANLGSDAATNNLGTMYANGRGVSKDPRKAFALYAEAAARGSSNGRQNLAAMYAEGAEGIPRDDTKAVELYRQDADEGSAAGQYGLALMYENGRGGLQTDVKKAAELYRLAADQGYAAAQNNLALLYENGIGGLPKDEAKAVELYKQAAAQGNEPAKDNLARLGK